MYEYAHRDKFYRDECQKTYVIMFPSDDDEEEFNVLSNDDIFEESFEIFYSITDQKTLNFQNCRSTYIQFETRYMDEVLYGKELLVYEIVEDDTENPIPIGTFICQSDTISDDGTTRQIIAYDRMYDIINSEITDWYRSLDFPITIKDLRDGLFNEYGIEQDNISLINDDIEVPKQISDEDTLIGGNLVKMIAEINAVFPIIKNDGLLHWLSLDVGDINETALYPSLTTYPGETTYPGTGYHGTFIDIYKNQYQENSVKWSNFLTLKADAIQIRNSANEIAYQTGEAENPYILINNFLCYDLSYGQYEIIARRLLNKIRLIEYVPCTLTKMGDPCIEVGDRIIVHTQENVQFITYLFNKHVTGTLVQWEEIQTDGTYYLGQYDVGKNNPTSAKLKNLDNRVGNIEKSGSGPLQIVSVPALPENPQLNVLYLIQGEVTVS